MELQQFSDWLASTAFSQAIQLSTWAIPTIQTLHIIALALLFTSALIVALRFSGLGLAVESLQMLAGRFTRVIWCMLVVLACTGALLIIAEPHRTISNPIFYTKMILLLVAIVLTAWLASVARHPHERLTALQRGSAALTMLLWMGIIFAGRFIAYYDAY